MWVPVVVGAAALIGVMITGLLNLRIARKTREETRLDRAQRDTAIDETRRQATAAADAARAAHQAVDASRSAAAQLDVWRQREETFKELRWMSDHAVSGTEPEQVAFGLQALAELTTNLQLVQAADREFTRNVSVIVWQVARSAALTVLMNAVEQDGGTGGSGGSIALSALLKDAAQIVRDTTQLLGGSGVAAIPSVVKDIGQSEIGRTLEVTMEGLQGLLPPGRAAARDTPGQALGDLGL